MTKKSDTRFREKMFLAKFKQQSIYHQNSLKINDFYTDVKVVIFNPNRYYFKQLDPHFFSEEKVALFVETSNVIRMKVKLTEFNVLFIDYFWIVRRIHFADKPLVGEIQLQKMRGFFLLNQELIKYLACKIGDEINFKYAG